jgi:hypothetical protein
MLLESLCVQDFTYIPGLAWAAELDEESAPTASTGVGVILILTVPTHRNKCRKYHLGGRPSRPELPTSGIVRRSFWPGAAKKPSAS